MSKIKVGVIFGGMSTEHDVSIVSGTSVVKKLNKETPFVPLWGGRSNECIRRVSIHPVKKTINRRNGTESKRSYQQINKSGGLNNEQGNKKRII